MQESDVLRMLYARCENYTISSITHLQGRTYHVVMNKVSYKAVILVSSFDYYEKRYHAAKNAPTLVICYEHNTVLSIPCLSLRLGNLAQPYELPESIIDVETQRRGKTGSRVLLGMYISGMRKAQTLVNELPLATRKRYLAKAKALTKRRRGKPVGRYSSPKEQ